MSATKAKVAVPSFPKTCGSTALSLTYFLVANRNAETSVHRSVLQLPHFYSPCDLFQIERIKKNKMSSTIPIKVEFTYVSLHPQICKTIPTSNPIPSGGLELLFASQRSHKIALPATDPATNQPVNVGFLIDWLCKNLMKDPRQDMFVLEGTV
jgi:hypothetical protein